MIFRFKFNKTLKVKRLFTIKIKLKGIALYILARITRSVGRQALALPNKIKMERKKMKFADRKTKTVLIALILMLTIAVPLFALQGVYAHPPRNVPIYAYVHVAPNPVGVGQTVNVVFWVDAVPPTAAGNPGNIIVLFWI